MEMCGKETFINKTLTDKHLIRLTGSCQRNVHEAQPNLTAQF